MRTTCVCCAFDLAGVLANPTVGLSTNASEVAAITSGRVIVFVFMNEA
jgi:hypothetical protein